MPIGPGTYDDLCTEVRQRTHAAAVMVIVIGGSRGAGFSIQASAELYPVIIGALRATADQIAHELEMIRRAGGN